MGSGWKDVSHKALRGKKLIPHVYTWSSESVSLLKQEVQKMESHHLARPN